MKPSEPSRGRFVLAEDHFRDHRPARMADSVRRAQQIAGRAGSLAVSAVLRTSEISLRLAAKAGRMIAPRNDPSRTVLARLAEAAHYAAVPNRLSALAPMSQEEITVLRRSTPGRSTHQAGSDIVVEGENARPLFIAKGWACRLRISASGRRLIAGLLLPGDGIALQEDDGMRQATTISALTCVETVDAEPLLSLARRQGQPGLRRAIRRAAALDEAFLVNQACRLGAMDSVERVAHLLLEIHWRLQQAGLANERYMPLPIKMDTVCDTLNLKASEVTRALGKLHRSRLLRAGYGRAELLDVDGLAKVSNFAPPAFGRSRIRPLVRDLNVTSRPELAPANQTPPPAFTRGNAALQISAGQRQT